MLYKKFESKVNCFFIVNMLPCHREVSVLLKSEMEGRIMQCRKTNNNILNPIYKEELV